MYENKVSISNELLHLQKVEANKIPSTLFLPEWKGREK